MMDLTRMKLGCRWQPGDAPPVAVTAAHVPDVPGAWGRCSAPRISGDNATIGDCVETAAANAVQTALARAGLPGQIANGFVVDLYSRITGYKPGDPATDRGTNPADLFRYCHANAIGGYRLESATGIEPVAEAAIRHAIVQTGGVFLVVALSVEQQAQTVWEPAGTPGSWGYHAVWCDSYDGALTFATSWGADMPIDRSYFTAPGFVQRAFSLNLTRA